MREGHCLREMVPFLGMVTVEATNVVLNVLFKSAVSRGMSVYVFIVYSYVFATILLFPLLFLFNRFASPFLFFFSPSNPATFKNTIYPGFNFNFAEGDCFFPLSKSLSFVKSAALASLGTQLLQLVHKYSKF